jgi:hypothetical protein
MLSEIELYFGGNETSGPATMTLHIVDLLTVTEITNYAYRTMKEQGATGVSFGPPVPRNERGLPA